MANIRLSHESVFPFIDMYFESFCMSEVLAARRVVLAKNSVIYPVFKRARLVRLFYLMQWTL